MDSTLPTKEQLQDLYDSEKYSGYEQDEKYILLNKEDIKALAHSRLTNNHFYLLKSTI